MQRLLLYTQSLSMAYLTEYFTLPFIAIVTLASSSNHTTFITMVQVSTMLLGLVAMTMAGSLPTNLADKAPAFVVPNFDYETLSTENTPNDVLVALKKDGTISFTNVPSYAQVRRAYLDSAAACAVSAQEVNTEFLLHKTLSDGTNRYTIILVAAGAGGAQRGYNT
ncbi:unnamed protein product [Phytophthora fragariaefolia]|uniref:Unnamed protein product n=1 Tax=Phytophthora fragariaefolia TaxID=1490495 RepID=A0A9W7D9J9_9STRA|nr:unnamed protein product [Phytophthora fragariaefolia]